MGTQDVHPGKGTFVPNERFSSMIFCSNRRFLRIFVSNQIYNSLLLKIMQLIDTFWDRLQWK